MLGDRIWIQKDFNRLELSAEKEMEVIMDKCKSLDLGPRNRMRKLRVEKIWFNSNRIGEWIEIHKI